MDPRTGLPVVGMVGAGQLARMTYQAAIALGVRLRVLAGDAHDAAAQVAHDVVLGSHRSYDDLAAFAAGCDVITFDHEQVPPEVMAKLAAAGHQLRPSPDALQFAQDKRAMREKLSSLDLRIPHWAAVSTVDDIVDFAGRSGWPVVVKAVRGGYDGRGVWLVPGPDEAASLATGGADLIVEEHVAMRRELAAVVARSPFGQLAAWPVVETVQREGVCVQVLAPAPGIDPDLAVEAQRIAATIAGALDVTGVLAVEMFETSAGLVVNELAMRPHNSAHWTIEGSCTSQFEQHLRAVLDYPLGDPRAMAPAVAMANVFGPAAEQSTVDERVHHVLASDPGAKIHWYGKQSRPGRKLGHVTVSGDDPVEVRERAARAAAGLQGGGR